MAIVLEQHVYNANGSAGTSLGVTFSTTPDSGNVLITAAAMNKASGAITVPTGFTFIGTTKTTGSVSGALAYKISDGTEGTVTWNWSTAQAVVAFIAEYSDVDNLDVNAEADSGESSVSSQTTGTTATTSVADSLAFAIHGIDTYTNFNPGETLSNSFSIIGSPPTTADVGLVCSSKIVASTGTQETTLTSGGGSDQVFGKIAVFNLAPAAGGVPPIAYNYRRRR